MFVGECSSLILCLYLNLTLIIWYQISQSTFEKARNSMVCIFADGCSWDWWILVNIAVYRLHTYLLLSEIIHYCGSSSFCSTACLLWSIHLFAQWASASSKWNNFSQILVCEIGKKTIYNAAAVCPKCWRISILLVHLYAKCFKNSVVFQLLELRMYWKIFYSITNH